MQSHKNTAGGKSFIKELKELEKYIKNNPLLEENRLFERELKGLIATAREQFFSLKDGLPLLGEKTASLEEINDESVSELISLLSENRYIGEEDINSLIWQSKFCIIKAAVKNFNKLQNSEDYIRKLYSLRELDIEKLTKLSPVHRAFVNDEIYNKSSLETKAMYRKKAALIARCVGISEERYTEELIKRAKLNELHLGEVIKTDYRNVFPYLKSGGYILWLFIISILFSLAVGMFTKPVMSLIAFFPVFTVIKSLQDFILSRFIRSEPLPKIEIKDELPSEGRTLCAISALISDEAGLSEALMRLKTASLKNPQRGIGFVLLCDLKAGDSEALDEDKSLFEKAQKLRESIFPDSIIIFRKRTYVKTMRKWQGYERKRGAIEELLRYMCKENISFAFISGEEPERIKEYSFLCALDLDTIPLMDSIKELTAAALHPLNKDYGIIAPRCTTDLSSALKTPFSRIMAGNGGICGISSYDSISGEFYFDAFGEGIFCGKGLIRKEKFLSACKDAFRKERVLSHDILEGGLCGVAYAGDIEFSDSFPPSSKAYFKRAHRWIRGDFQNLAFIFKKEFSALTKFKLFDNFRRGIAPIFTLSLFFLSAFNKNGFILGIVAYLAIFIPFLPPLVASILRGFAFGITRRFYSPILSETIQLSAKALLELMTLSKSALVSFDAAVKTLWRMCITKRKLLEWTTSGFMEKTAFKGGIVHLIPAFILSIILLTVSLYGSLTALPAAVLMTSAFVVLAYSDLPRKNIRASLSPTAREELLSHVKKMWNFYLTYTNEESGYLPPDNVQFYPVFRICMRTSPTNIGMYLLSAAAVYELGIIDDKKLTDIVEKTVESVEKLDKWKGNLYNWYDLKTLKPISDFVSSVDSGNFIACLIALKEALRLRGLSYSLIKRCEKLIEETKLGAFYNFKRKLFSIGYDIKEAKLSPHLYDMLMSEARLMSYVGIAMGEAPKSHWRMLSRTMSRSGRYAGAIAWTGTMFEFYMPELLLTSKEGSMSYESLRYAFHCQKRRHTPFGISESGYYAFDSELNYQYKAHGVQKTALKADMNKECVISPYSSYLTLSAYPLESWNNLVRLEKAGLFNPNFGFYEAADYTRLRIGGKGLAIVKSHMAHHMGMSIAGAANALKNNICAFLFLSDEKMKRAEELLEEKIMAGEKVLSITDYHYDNEKNTCRTEEITSHTVFGSLINTLCGGALSLFTSANGQFYASYKKAATVNKSYDYLERPSGAFYGFCDERKIYPFFYHPSISKTSDSELKTVFSPEESVYIRENSDIRFSQTISVSGEFNAELRKFSFKNKTKLKKQYTLCAFSEPVLANDKDYIAHPMFMDLFLKIEYDEDNRLFIFYRKHRENESVIACAAGFMDETDFTYCLSKEECEEHLAFSFFKKALIRENVQKSVPAPCLFIKAVINLDFGESGEATLFYCYADSVEKAKENALLLRKNGLKKGSNAFPSPSPLSIDTLHGRMASRILSGLLYGDTDDCEVLESRRLNTLNRRALWRYGISGDKPLISADYSEDLSSLSLMKCGLTRCGIECDLIILCDNALEKSRALEIVGDVGYTLIKSELDDEMLRLIKALSVSINPHPKKYLRSKKNGGEKAYSALPIIPCTHEGDENGFSENGYTIGDRKTAKTWCSVLSNPNFGTLLSNNSLGFTWAINSRENKLTPWNNDIIKDNSGEMLLIKTGGVYYDLIRGSRAEFSPDLCSYIGKLPYIESKTEVRVYSEGSAKEISVTLINNTDANQNIDLVYKITPIMGSVREASMPIAYTEGGALIFENSQNPYFKGKMVLYSNKKAHYCFSRSDIAQGDFSKAESETERIFCHTAAAVIPLKISPNEKLRIRFILGYHNDEATSGALALKYIKDLEGGPCGISFEHNISIKTPDQKLDSLFNVWLPHQITACRLYARTGFFQNGGAYGFRDQLQDSLAIMYFSPKTALEHIMRCCRSQFFEGDVLHWWHELNKERVGVRTRYSDDLLWLPYVACEYDNIWGEEGFWEQNAEYSMGDSLSEEKQELFMSAASSGFSESLYIHCKKAMEKGFNKGSHGLIKIGCGDWNDGYNNVGAKGEGESVWLSMFYIMCAKRFAEAARNNNDGDYAEKLEKRITELYISIEENAWDGDRYLRAYYDSGEKMGSSESDACKIDLLPQAFSVLCSLPDTERSSQALKSAQKLLVDKKNGIIKLFSPAFSYENSRQRPGYVMSYPEGVRENGGQYTHAAVWYCMACFKAGQKEEALELLNMLNPAYRGKEFEREPYYMTADIYTNPACYGRGGWSMYTGAAAWYWKCIIEGLFGLTVKKGRLTFKPNLPKEFSGSSVMIFGRKITFIYAPGERNKDLSQEDKVFYN